MNKQTTQILELGIFFAGAVIILDVLLAQIPLLDWLALGLAFFLAAALILGSVSRTIPKQARKAISIGQKEDQFRHLADVVDAAVYGRNKMALRILSEQLKSLALGTIAARARLSRKEILELAEKEPQSLSAIVQDEEMRRLLAGYPPLGEGVSEKELEEILFRIESWSR